MKKDYYIYPAIFEYNQDGISISFPDLPGCISCASNDEEALYMAKDALGLFIASCEEDGDELPAPTILNNIKLKNNQKPALIEVNMPLFRDAIFNVSVKKTLTIPKWINDLAEKNNINFSQVLQSALKKCLGINK
ncbi:MAG: type II toxin-antitoxin system HicB family antitoxin [Clostridia bacterium]|nr:type II toxin-antitoxin system HicB family antitoxin [Clostridia bacterium]